MKYFIEEQCQVRLDQDYLHGAEKKGIFFSVSLMMTTLMKPNFLIGFAPMVALGLLYDLIKNIKDIKCIKKIIAFGCLVFPWGVWMGNYLIFMSTIYLYLNNIREIITRNRKCSMKKC